MSSDPPTHEDPPKSDKPGAKVDVVDVTDKTAEVVLDPAFAPTSEVPAVDDPAPSEKAESVPPPDPLETAQAEATRLRDLWIRSVADFDNYRKRSRRDVEDARKGGREELLKELLPVFDNLERAIQSAQRAVDADSGGSAGIKAVADGLAMILKQFNDTLARVGISKVATTGSAFDPSVHEAIQHVETSEHPPGTVIAEVQPGYQQGERLVRAAMVVVAKPKGEGQAN